MSNIKIINISNKNKGKIMSNNKLPQTESAANYGFLLSLYRIEPVERICHMPISHMPVAVVSLGT